LKTTTSLNLCKDISLPLAHHTIFNKLYTFIKQNRLELDVLTKTIKSEGDKTKIPTDYQLTDMLAIDTYTIKDGILVKKAKENHPDGNKKKLIIANKASFVGAFIDNGRINLTGNHKFYILGDNLEKIVSMFSYKIMYMVSQFTKYGQDFLDRDAFNYVPDIRKLGITDITEEKLYEMIGLTESEKESISKFC
jgi:hypothetical protein